MAFNVILVSSEQSTLLDMQPGLYSEETRKSKVVPLNFNVP